MQYLADFLTLSRFIFALLFPLAGFLYGEAALPWVISGLIIGWTTDILDGFIARKAHLKTPSIIGKNDFTFDMLMVYGSFVYFTQIGIVPFWFFTLYSLVSFLTIAKYPIQSVVMCFAAPIDALTLFVAVSKTPALGRIFLLWIVAALLLDWRRFLGVVEEFVEGFRKEIFEKRHPFLEDKFSKISRTIRRFK